MKKIFPSEKVYVAKSEIPHTGRGVFADVEIKKGEVIERSPIVEIPANDTAALSETILSTYFFYFGRKREQVALTLGFGSLYNHSKNPNAKFKIKGQKMMIEFIAIKKIKKDEEITFNYYGSEELKKKKKPLWFEN